MFQKSPHEETFVSNNRALSNSLYGVWIISVNITVSLSVKTVEGHVNKILHLRSELLAGF